MIEPKLIRIFFEKRGRAKYISHLDINRCMGRAFARSSIPIWYTEGFNPHVYMTFSQPLSLGFESECESVDIKLIDEISFDEVVTKLNAVLPEGIRAIRADIPKMKPEKIAYSDYDITLELDGKTKDELIKATESFFSQNEIVVMKKSKKGLKEVDIKPMFEVISLECEDAVIKIMLRCVAGITTNLNPNLVIDTFKNQSSMNVDCSSVLKKEIYTENLDIFA